MDWSDLLVVQGTFKNIYACKYRVAFVSLSCVFGLISFRMDWLDLLVVQGTLKNIYACKYRVALVSLSCVFERMIQVTTEVFRRGQRRLCCPRGRCRYINPCELCLSGGRGVCVTKTTTGVMTFTTMFTE